MWKFERITNVHMYVVNWKSHLIENDACGAATELQCLNVLNWVRILYKLILFSVQTVDGCIFLFESYVTCVRFYLWYLYDCIVCDEYRQHILHVHMNSDPLW